MDSVTQAVLGAAVGQAVAGRVLGRRAALWGAAAGLLPDLDVLAAIPLGARGEFLYHRGPTHSLLVCLVAGVLFGEAIWRRRRRKLRDQPPPAGTPIESRSAWILLFTAVFVTHPLLDWFTAYGTQLLWPFTAHRFALNGVAIIDPFYTGVLLVGIGLGWSGARPRAPWAALAISTAYLFAGSGLNHAAEWSVREHLAQSTPQRGVVVRCYPTLFQPFLRRVVVREPDGYRVGTFTHLAQDSLRLERVTPAPDARVDRLLETPLGRIFRWFAMDMVAGRVKNNGDGVIVEIDDLRYGIPGGPPERGLWYLHGRFDRHGRLIGDVVRHRRSLLAPAGQLLHRFWQAILGRPLPPPQTVVSRGQSGST